jgi:hypothetical protein
MATKHIGFCIKNKYNDNLDDPDSSSISIASPEQDFAKMENPDEIVIKEKKVTISFDYPFDDSNFFSFENPKGFSRIDLARIVCEQYKKMYQEERETTEIPEGKIQGMLNRNKTNGKYGIFGHDLEDLVLHSVIRDESGIYLLGVDS